MQTRAKCPTVKPVNPIRMRRCKRSVHRPPFSRCATRAPMQTMRVMDVLGELVLHNGPHFAISLAAVAVGSRKSFEIGHRLNVPNDDVAHGWDSTAWRVQ